jgi:hypothetical protein
LKFGIFEREYYLGFYHYKCVEVVNFKTALGNGNFFTFIFRLIPPLVEVGC